MVSKDADTQRSMFPVSTTYQWCERSFGGGKAGVSLGVSCKPGEVVVGQVCLSYIHTSGKMCLQVCPSHEFYNRENVKNEL